jgi:RNA polymerase sigma-70 factor, ECF subfamily
MQQFSTHLLICSMDFPAVESKNIVSGETFETLVKQHQSQLKSFLYRFMASREDVEDISQEAFIKAYQKQHLFKGESSFKTWLFAIATNLAKDHLRAKKRWTGDAQDKCKSLIGTSPELAKELRSINQNSEYGAYEIREHIDFCFTCIMKTLPLEQHLSLMLSDIYAFKIKEIAEILEATEGVIKHHLHDARTTMQNVFEHRCALINKEGVCNQCTELNGFNNTKAETQRLVAEMKLVNAAKDPDKIKLFRIRTALVKTIDPLNAKGTNLHDFLLNCTRQALEQE